jgi:hypothetical protein
MNSSLGNAEHRQQKRRQIETSTSVRKKGGSMRIRELIITNIMAQSLLELLVVKKFTALWKPKVRYHQDVENECENQS